MKNLFKLLFLMVIFIFIILFYAIKIEPYILTTKTYFFEKNENGETLRIVHLSDFELSQNYTDNQLNNIVKKTNSLDPDIIVFTGDLFSNYSKYNNYEQTLLHLSNLSAKYGKYAIWGNNDYGGGAKRIYEEIMFTAGFTVLKNEGITVNLENGQSIFIGGLDDLTLGTPDFAKTMAYKKTTTDLTVILAHDPDSVHLVTDSTVDIILIGHTHGGQVNIKYLQKKFNIHEQYLKGEYNIEHLDNTKLYISNGFGTSRMPIRFFTPPQIVELLISI